MLSNAIIFVVNTILKVLLGKMYAKAGQLKLMPLKSIEMV